MYWKPPLDEGRPPVVRAAVNLNRVIARPLFDYILAVLLIWTTLLLSNMVGLLTWGGSLIVVAILFFINSQQDLVPGITLTNGRNQARLTTMLNSANGLVWGVAPSLKFDKITSTYSQTKLSLKAAVAVASVAAILIWPLFLAFSSFCQFYTGTPLKLAHIQDLHGQIFLALAALNLQTLIVQSHIQSRALVEVMQMRLEKAELASRLLEEARRSQEAEQLQAATLKDNVGTSKFLASASHDLKQPMHSLRLVLELIEGTKLTSEQRKLLKSAQAACSSTTEMLDTLLDFSRIEAGAMCPRFNLVSIHNLLGKIEDEMAPVANQKGLFYRYRERIAYVESDAVLLELIIRNLVTNAIRYTLHGGVLVGTRIRCRSLLIEVWDTGIGIAPQDHQAIFREFHQLGNPERDRNKGLGLGLANVRRLVKDLNLTLSLQSTPGKGSVFRISLPILNLEENQHTGCPSGDDRQCANIPSLQETGLIKRGMNSLA